MSEIPDTMLSIAFQQCSVVPVRADLRKQRPRTNRLCQSEHGTALNSFKYFKNHFVYISLSLYVSDTLNIINMLNIYIYIYNCYIPSYIPSCFFCFLAWHSRHSCIPTEAAGCVARLLQPDQNEQNERNEQNEQCQNMLSLAFWIFLMLATKTMSHIVI